MDATYPSRLIPLQFIKFIKSINFKSARCEYSNISCFFLTNIFIKYQCSFVHSFIHSSNIIDLKITYIRAVDKIMEIKKNGGIQFICVGYTERTSVGNTECPSSVCLESVMLVSIH
jgi:hypothetical protein